MVFVCLLDWSVEDYEALLQNLENLTPQGGEVVYNKIPGDLWAGVSVGDHSPEACQAAWTKICQVVSQTPSGISELLTSLSLSLNFSPSLSQSFSLFQCLHLYLFLYLYLSISLYFSLSLSTTTQPLWLFYLNLFFLF